MKDSYETLSRRAHSNVHPKNVNANAHISVTKKASSPIERIPYDPILYGDQLARRFNEDARRHEYNQGGGMGKDTDHDDGSENNNHDPKSILTSSSSLGESGNFNNVLQSIPLETLIEERVYGPAHADAIHGEYGDMFYSHDESTSGGGGGDGSDVVTTSKEEHGEGNGNHKKSDRVTGRAIKGKDGTENVSYMKREGDGEHTTRDEIIFMSKLDDGAPNCSTGSTDAPSKRKSKLEPETIRGKEWESSSLEMLTLLDEPHLTVSEQLSGRLVKIRKDGSIPATRTNGEHVDAHATTNPDHDDAHAHPYPPIASHYKLHMEDPGENVELNPNINTQLKHALSSFEKQFQYACLANVAETSIVTGDNGSNRNGNVHHHDGGGRFKSFAFRRHCNTVAMGGGGMGIRMGMGARLSMFPGRISRKCRSVMSGNRNHRNRGGGGGHADDEKSDKLKKMPNGDDPNVALRRGIDALDNSEVVSALKHGADINRQDEEEEENSGTGSSTTSTRTPHYRDRSQSQRQNRGRSPFQTIFSRLCRIDAGKELGEKMKEYETLAQTLYSWGCDLNALDCPKRWNGWAPVHYAASDGKFKRLEWITRCGGNIHERTALDGQTPLMLSCGRGNFEKAYYLIQNGANFRQCDWRGNTVLHYAAASGNFLLVQFLVECGCVHDKLKKSSNGAGMGAGAGAGAGGGESPLSISAKVNPRCYEYLGKITISRPLSLPFIDHITGTSAGGGGGGSGSDGYNGSSQGGKMTKERRGWNVGDKEGRHKKIYNGKNNKNSNSNSNNIKRARKTF